MSSSTKKRAASTSPTTTPPPRKTSTRSTPSKIKVENVTPSPILASRSQNASLKAAATPEPLFCLAQDDELIRATLVCRPSKRNRSPYVADVWLEDEQREAIAHVPSLDMGGKCVVGVLLLLKPARDRKGEKVGSQAVSPKYGTPKCEFITQLLHLDESELHAGFYPPVWVGAHPALGERITQACLEATAATATANVLYADAVNVQGQVRNPCGADMRSDFMVTHASGVKRIVEVKTVVDTDYCVDFVPTADVKKCLFTCNDSSSKPYSRTAIFPWGTCKQKGPDGEKVVSTRAIHHVRELTRIASGELTGEDGERYKATIVFVVIRGDATSFRPNGDACPSFEKYLRLAKEAGVDIIVKRVSWGPNGECFDDGLLPLEWS